MGEGGKVEEEGLPRDAFYKTVPLSLHPLLTCPPPLWMGRGGGRILTRASELVPAPPASRDYCKDREYGRASVVSSLMKEGGRGGSLFLSPCVCVCIVAEEGKVCLLLSSRCPCQADGRARAHLLSSHDGLTQPGRGCCPVCPPYLSEGRRGRGGALY